jgi:chromosome partitioning protein
MLNHMKKPKRQIRLLIASNAGGSGKTTLAVHLAYEVGAKGYKTTLVELDSNSSFRVFLGLNPPSEEVSIASVLRKTFNGIYPTNPIWQEHLSTVTAIQGGEPLRDAATEISSYDRREYVLKDRLEDVPLDSDLIIFDTPATLEPMGLLALVACTHILVPIKPEFKDTGSFDGLLNWYYTKVGNLRLKPAPVLLGFVPTRVDLSKSTHRNILGVDAKGKVRTDLGAEDTLPAIIEAMGIQCFPIVKESSWFLSASGAGLPVHLYRKGCEASKPFRSITDSIIKAMTEE